MTYWHNVVWAKAGSFHRNRKVVLIFSKFKNNKTFLSCDFYTILFLIFLGFEPCNFFHIKQNIKMLYKRTAFFTVTTVLIALHHIQKCSRRDIARIGTKPVYILSFRQALVQSNISPKNNVKAKTRSDRISRTTLNT